jgi:hypothetical protein
MRKMDEKIRHLVESVEELYKSKEIKKVQP